jgi:hypothetical protein
MHRLVGLLTTPQEWLSTKGTPMRIVIFYLTAASLAVSSPAMAQDAFSSRGSPVASAAAWNVDLWRKCL